MSKAILLSDKHRPDAEEGYIEQEDVVIDVMKFVDNPEEMPNFGFTGAGGIGKTTLALRFAKALGDKAEVLIFTSDEDKNQAFVEQLKHDIRNPPVYAVIRLIIMDEVSEMSSKAKTSLRALLEIEAPWNKFILIYNYPAKMPKELLDRLLEFKFRRLSEKGIMARLETIVQLEGLIPQERSLEVIASRSNGSMRRAFNLLQEYTRNKFVSARIDDTDDSVTVMFNAIWDVNMDKAWDTYLIYQRKGRYIHELPQMFISVIDKKFSKNYGMKAILSRHIMQLARDMAIGLEPDVCIFGFFGNIFLIAEKQSK